MMSPRIRVYEDRDEPEVIRIWEECHLIVPQNDPGKDILRKLRVNRELFLGGEIDGHVVATCMAGYEGHRGWINYLAVLPEFRRNGLATEIMTEAARLLHAAGCPKINLQIRTTNSAVIEFYKSIGYSVDSVTSSRVEFLSILCIGKIRNGGPMGRRKTIKRPALLAVTIRR